MLAIKNAKDFDENPIPIAIDEAGNLIYYVNDNELPALKPKKQPLEYLTDKELYALKKKYKVSNRVLQRVQECYRNKHKHIELGDDNCLENRLLIQELEDIILMKMKKQLVLPYEQMRKVLPYYDSSITGRIALHTTICCSSGGGKSTLTAQIIAKNFAKSDVFIFSPTAGSDPAYKSLQEKLGRKRVRLINSNSIDIPLDESMVKKGSVVVFDDQESVAQPSRRFINDLQNKLLYHGRHLQNKAKEGITVFSVMHDSFRSKETKASAIESSRVILFPNLNRGNTTKFLKSRLNMTSKEIKKIYQFIGKSRWFCIFRHHPNVIISPDKIMIR